MKTDATLIHNLTPEQIESLFAGLQEQLNELKQNFQPKVPDELLTRNETATFFKCDLSTIHNWSVKGILIPFGICGRVFYKRSDLESALIPFGKNKGTDHE